MSVDPTWSPQARTKVTVLVTTYNHEKFIVQALESVLMQRTNFDYDVVVIEDCSTDSTRDTVIDFQRAYPGKIKIILSEKNRCDNANFCKAYLESSSQYVALLDGDDFWTSPHKLQRQADFLDTNPESAMCFHNATVFYEDRSREPWYRNPVDQKAISTLEDLWACNFIAGCSPMLRRDLFDEFPSWYADTGIPGDWPLYLLSTQHGNIGYIDEVMGAYRIHSRGLWSSLNETQKLERLIEFYEAMNRNLRFRYDAIVTRMISKCHVQLAVERGGLPQGVTVIVVDEGEDPLLYWEGRQPWRFPQNGNGANAGRYPIDDDEAIAQLEELRARGGDYLFFPGTTVWWLDRYKGLRQHLDSWHRRVWENRHGVIYKLRAMPTVEVTEVTLAEADPRLWGRHIDLPKPNTRAEASALDLVGWVLGKSSAAVAVEVLSEETVLRRVPLNARRPDIAKAFPNVTEAENGGFKATISALGTEAGLELSVRAVLGDQSRVPLGTIRGRRRWEAAEEERAGAALVSVVIPCYNQARFLGEAIESVLRQTYPHFEIVVVDDGSTDNTSEVASRYPGVRCVRQENQGLAGARNAGIRHSRGSYLVFLDADDRLLPGALGVGLKHLKERPECAFVSGHWKLIAADGSPLPTPDPMRVEKDYYDALLRSCYISTPAAVMYQRIMLEHIGGFDTSVSSSADYNLYLRVARQYPVHHHGKVVAEYRRHGSNMTRDPALMLKSEVTVLRRQRKYLRRRQQYKAYQAGIQHSQEYFGEPLVEEVRTLVQERKCKQAIRGLRVLLRYHPQGLVSALGDGFS
jgi:glycosyltransferase involved in cell wall biosynthesis